MLAPNARLRSRVIAIRSADADEAQEAATSGGQTSERIPPRASAPDTPRRGGARIRWAQLLGF